MKNEATIKELNVLKSQIGEVTSDVQDIKRMLSALQSLVHAMERNATPTTTAKKTTVKAAAKVQTVNRASEETEKQVSNHCFCAFPHKWEYVRDGVTISTSAIVIVSDKRIPTKERKERAKAMSEMFGTPVYYSTYIMGFVVKNVTRTVYDRIASHYNVASTMPVEHVQALQERDAKRDARKANQDNDNNNK